MRQSLDPDKAWKTGRKAALRYLKAVGSNLSAPAACLFTLDELLSEDFDIDAALAKLAAAKLDVAKDIAPRDTPGS